MRTGRPRKPNMCELSYSDKLKLWEDYKPLIVVIGEQRIRGCRILELGDLISEGFLGLIRAAELFDSDRGTKFFTHAGYWIKGFMIRLIKSMEKEPLQRFPLLEEILKNEATTRARKSWSLELKPGEELNDFLERYLDPEAVEIIKLKFGLDGNDVLTCEQIAEKIKKSKPTILKIFRKSLQKLRKALED